MKKIFSIMALAIATATITSCGNNQNYPNATVNVQPASQQAADGLNLQAVGAMANSCQSAADLEQKLNQPNGLNNLDLDGNGQTDFINVTESVVGGSRVFDLTTLVNGQPQQIANITTTPNGGNYQNGGTMYVTGNQAIYGQNAVYQNTFSASDAFIIWMLMSHRPYYVSPWHYGYYPGYYRSYAPVAYSAYSTRTRQVMSTSTTKVTKVTNVNNVPKAATQSKYANSNASTGIKQELRQPTQAQREFSTKSYAGERMKTNDKYKTQQQQTTNNATANATNTNQRRMGGSTATTTSNSNNNGYAWKKSTTSVTPTTTPTRTSTDYGTRRMGGSSSSSMGTTRSFSSGSAGRMSGGGSRMGGGSRRR